MDVAGEAGLTNRSQALRSLVRMAAGLIEAVPAQLEEVGRAPWLLGKQGVLLNQLARATHRGKLRLTEADRRLLQETLQATRRLEDALRERSSTRRSAGACMPRPRSNPQRPAAMADALALYRLVMGEAWNEELKRAGGGRQAAAAREAAHPYKSPTTSASGRRGVGGT